MNGPALKRWEEKQVRQLLEGKKEARPNANDRRYFWGEFTRDFISVAFRAPGTTKKREEGD